MTLYRYRALQANGTIAQGVLDALHPQDLDAQLQRLNLSLLRASPSRKRQIRRKNMSRAELIQFIFQLEIQLQSGVPIRELLADLSLEGNTARSRQLAVSLLHRIEAGASLASACAASPEVFSPLLQQLLVAGETTGQLSEILGEIRRTLQWQQQLTRQTQRLLIYPAFVALTVGAVIIFLLAYLVPQLAGFLAILGQELPLATRALMLSADFVRHYGLWLLAGGLPILLMMYLLQRHIPAWRLRLHRQLLHLPVLGHIQLQLQLARCLDILALLYRSGIPMLSALEQSQFICSNLALQTALGRIKSRVAAGSSLASSFAAEALMPRLLVRMLQVGERSGRLDTSLQHVTTHLRNEIETALGRMQAAIEPLLTLLLGLLLGWIMLAVFSPIYDSLTQLEF